MGCLNLSNPQVKEWIDSVGFDETYRQYLSHNYNLPKYKAFLQKGAYAGLNRVEVKNQLSKMLNTEAYDFDVIEKILDMAPEAQAAFFKNTFYFADSANSLQVNEEAFHSVFQTLTSPEERKALYVIAETLLQDRAKRANKSVQQLLNNYKTSTGYTGNYLYNYALEEELAKAFVNWYTYDNQLVAEQSIRELWKNKDVSLVDKVIQTLSELFDKLLNLVRGYKNNKDILETYFSSIKDGKYKLDSPKYSTDSVFPSLSTIKLFSSATTKEYVMDAVEQNLMYSKVLALAYQVKEQVTKMSDTEIIQTSLDAYVNHLKSSPNASRKTQTDDLISNLEQFEEEDTDARIIAVKDLVERFVTREQEEDSLFDNLAEENEQGEQQAERQYGEEANTIDHYTSLSKKIKAIMQTIHVKSGNDPFVTHSFKNNVGQDFAVKLRLNRMADPTKIYAAVIRATSNAGTEVEKLRNLILFTRDSDLNTDTKAFVDYTFERLFGDNVDDAKTAILNKKSITDLVVDPNYYQSLVKAFDLWTRPSKIYEFSLEKNFFNSFNPNMTNVKSIQLDKWEKKWREIKDSFFSAENVRSRATLLNDVVFKTKGSFLLSEEEDYTNLAFDSEESLTAVYASLGVTPSKNYIKYIVAKTYIENLDLGSFLPQSFRDIYESFLLEESEIDEDLVGFGRAIAGEDSFDIDQVYIREKDKGETTFADKGFVTRFDKVALGNAVFDESVLATSYLDADNKRRYAHQVKTFALRFLGSVVKDNEKINQHEEELKTFSTESEIFLKGNRYLDFIKSLSPKEKSRLKFSSYGGAQLKDFKSNEKISETVNEIVADDFVALEANALIDSVYTPRKEERVNNVLGINEDANSKLSVNYFTGFVEATNTLTMFTGKWFNDTATEKMVDYKQGSENREKAPSDVMAGDMAVNMAYELIEQQVNRIKSVDKQIQALLDPKQIGKDGLALKITSKFLRDSGFSGDIIDKYHTGTVNYKLDANGKIQLDIAKNLANKKALPRAFTITTALDGYYNDEAVVHDHFFNNGPKENIDESIRLSLNNLLDTFMIQIADSDVGLSKEYATTELDVKAKRLGFEKHDGNPRTKNTILKVNAGKFFFNSMFNREHFHRAAFGDSAVISKNDITDQSKRFKGFEGQMLSVKSNMTNVFKGVLKPLLEVRYVTEVSSANDTKDLNTSGLWDGVDKGSKKVDQDDAQSRTTVQFTRSYLHGLDRLSNDLVWVIDKVQNGIPFTEEEEKIIKKNKLTLGVEKSRGFSQQQDIKHGVQILRKLETSLKNDVTGRPDSLLEDLEANITVTHTLKDGSSYFVTPKEGATRELTVEFDAKKYTSYQEAFLDNALKIYEWTPKSNFLHTRRKMMEGWRTVNGVETYSEKNEFDLLSPTEAHKRRISNVAEDINDLNTDSTYIQSLDAEFYGRQVENPGKDAVTDPSQQIEIITSTLSKTIDFISNGKKESVSKDVIVKHFQKLLAKRDSTNILTAIEELRDEQKNINLGLFYDKIIETLKETGADRQLVESFALKNGKPVVNGNLPFIKNKLEDYLFAHFTKGVLVQKRDGDAKAMVSPRGQVILKRAVKKKIGKNTVMMWESIPSSTAGYNELFAKASSNRFEELGLSYNGQSKDKHRNTLQDKLNTLKEGDYFTDELRFNVPVERNGVVQYFTETVIPKYHHKQKTIQDSFRYLTGVRIPSQDKSTSANLMIVDLLDISGSNTIITAKEIQHLSGADYDIDKIFTTYAEGYWVGSTFKLYDKSFGDYKKYTIKKNKTVSNVYKDLRGKNEKLNEIDNTLNELATLLAGYTPKNFKEDLDRITEITGILSGAKKYMADLIEKKREAVKNNDEALSDAFDRAIRVFQAKADVNKGNFEAYEEELKELNQVFKDADEVTTEKQAEVFTLLAERSKILENLKAEALKTLRLPSTEAEYLKTFPDGQYNAIVNNELLEASFSLLTSDPKAYSNITSVDPLRNIDKNSADSGLGIIAAARDLALKLNLESQDANFEYTPKIPYHSALFDSYYKKRIKASQTGIGAAVNANLSYLLLSRLGMKLAKPQIINYVNSSRAKISFSEFTEKMPNFPNQDKGKFVSDWISTTISVTTDEAKEGILAKYNLQGDIFTAFVTGLQLGMHPEMLIALLNNKNIQALNSNAEKNPLFTNKDSLKSLLLTEMQGVVKEVEIPDDTLTDDILVEGLVQYGTSNDYAVFSTVYKLLTIAEQNADVVKVMRVKRGLKPTYVELTDTILAVKRLGLGGPKYNQDHYPELVEDEHIAYDLTPFDKDESIAQFNNYINNVLPDVYDVVGQILLEGTKTYKHIANEAKRELNIPGYKQAEFEAELLTAFLGHTIAKVNSLPVMEEGQVPDATKNRQKTFTINPKKEDVVGDNTLAKEFQAMMLDPKIKKKVSGSPIFSRLLAITAESKLLKSKGKSTAIDAISLNVFSKVSPELQSDLMDDFASLTDTANEPTKEDIRIKNFLMRLLDYYAGKDALGYSPTSVSKMFAPTYFEDISNYFEHILKNQPIDSKITNEVLNRFVTDIRNIQYLKRIPVKPKPEDVIASVDFRFAGGSLVLISTKEKVDLPKYYRQTTANDVKINSVLRFVGSPDGFSHYYLEYPSLGHVEYKSSIAEGRFTMQKKRRDDIVNNLKTFTLPKTFPPNLKEKIDDHIARLEKISHVEVSTVEATTQVINSYRTTEQLLSYYQTLTKKQQLATKAVIRDKRRAIIEYIFQEADIIPKEHNFDPARRFYSGNIDILDSNEVIVFGANDRGLHGAGSAGVAMGEKRNEAQISALPDGTQGKWAVKGVHSKIAQGIEGMSYGLVTVEGKLGGKKKENRLNPKTLRNNIKEFYEEARNNKNLIFKVAYDAKNRNEKLRSGYTPLELATLFASETIPKNVQFEKSFSYLINELTGLENTQIYAEEEVESAEDYYNEEEEAYYAQQEQSLDLSGVNTIQELADLWQAYNTEDQKKYKELFTERRKQIQGVQSTEIIEISSNSRGLAAALTNPTELSKSKGNIAQSYPVDYRGKTYKDAEAAYQDLKSTATKDEGPNSTYNLMVDIIKAKLQQHPRLVSEITKQGGSQWILALTHQPTSKNTVWETGGKNWFIKALNEAYVSQQTQSTNTSTTGASTLTLPSTLSYTGSATVTTKETNLLSDKLLGFLNSLNFTTEFKDELLHEYDPESVTDLLYKTIKVKSSSKSDGLLKETAYVTYSFLGKKNKIRTELISSIENIDNYASIFVNYKERSPQLSDYKIKELITIDFIADAIKNNYETPKDSYQNRKADYWSIKGNSALEKRIKYLLGRVKRFVSTLFLDTKLSTQELNELVADIANDILNNNAQKFNTDLAPNQQLTNYENTIKRDAKAAEIVSNFQDLGLILTGSLALRKQGTLYREITEDLHDLDFSYAGGKHLEELESNFENYFLNKKTSLLESIAYSEYQTENVQSQKQDEYLSYIKKGIFQLVRDKKLPIIQQITWLYPEFKITSVFSGLEENTYTVAGTIGEYAIDLFLVKDKNLDQNLKSFQDWQPIFKAKLAMGRAKDMRDFANYTPFNTKSDSSFAATKGFRHFNFGNREVSLPDNIEDLDDFANFDKKCV